MKFVTVSASRLAELTTRKSRQSGVDLTPYKAHLSSLALGNWSAVEIEPGDKARAIKSNLNLAAKGMTPSRILRWNKQSGDMLEFCIRDAATVAADKATRKANKLAKAAAGGNVKKERKVKAAK